MGKCGVCGLEHSRPGEKTCRYEKDALEKCKECGADEKDWKLYLDVDGAARETENVELEVKPPVGADGVHLVAPTILPKKPEEPLDNIALAAELRKQKSDMEVLARSFSSISTQLDNLLSGAARDPGTSTAPSTHVPLLTGARPTASHSAGPTSGSIPSAADISPSPLTAALQQLTSAIDPDSSKKATGIYLHPEFYVQYKDNNTQVKDLDHRKLGFKSLLYGMCCVAKHLKSTGGNLDSYLDHMTFVCKTGHTDMYQDIAFAEYDICDRQGSRGIIDFFHS